MSRSFLEKRSRSGSLLIIFALAVSLLMSGCGQSSSYDEPVATQTTPIAGQTQSVLIDATTLKGWIDTGLVNNSEAWENVVILDVSSASGYAAGHIPGSQLWDGDSGIDRYEGPVLSSNMVLDGPMMDAALQKYGINECTTVVFAGASNPARIYFMFRYWGFSRDRLKILQGNKGAWTTAGYELTTEIPTVTPSTYSVRNLTLNPNVRASLNELIIAVEDGTAAPLNTLTNNTEKAGGTTGIFTPSEYCSDNLTYPYTLYNSVTCLDPATKVGDYVIFQGTINGAQHLSQALFYNADGTIKTVEEIKSLLAGVGIDGSKPIIAYCRAGNAASNGFTPIDAVLGWDVMVYDGSWSQWGSLTNQTDLIYVPDASYALPAQLSAWATDVLTMDGYRAVTDGPIIPGTFYNINFPKIIEKPTFRALNLMILDNALTPRAPGANSIEIEDRAYSETPPAGGAPTGTSGGSGGGC